MQSPNFPAVLRDIREAQADEADRLAELLDRRADLVADVRIALSHLGRCELSIDRRLWTREERDAYLSARDRYDAAYEALVEFDVANRGKLP